MNGTYIPALSYNRLTPLYDTVVRLTVREGAFKDALARQAGIEDGHRVLDLACGTATLTILLKQVHPLAEVIGIDGDDRILAIGRAKARAAKAAIQFDEGMSFDLPYPDQSFDRVVSSLFFHHLTRENKLKTIAEVKRVLRPLGELHVADWGLPANRLMKLSSRFVQMLDGFDTTEDSFRGRLPMLLTEAGFGNVEEVGSFNTLFGTIRLHRCAARYVGEYDS